MLDIGTFMLCLTINKKMSSTPMRNARLHRLLTAMATMASGALVSMLLAAPMANAANVSASSTLPKLSSDIVGTEGVLTVGGATTLAPYLFVAPGGEVKGLVADLMAEAAKRLHGTVKYMNLTYSALIPAIQAGRVDVGVGTLIDTAAREQQLDFVDYMTTRTVLMGKPDVAKGIESMADLCGRAAATATGGSTEQMLKAQNSACLAAGKKPITLYVVPSAAEAQLQVETGRADIFVQAYGVAVSIAKASPTIKIIGKPFKAEYHGVGVSKQNTALSNALMGAFKQMMDDGTYKSILARYGLSDLGLTAPVLNGDKTAPLASN